MTLAQSLKHLLHVLIRPDCTSIFKGHIGHIIIWICPSTPPPPPPPTPQKQRKKSDHRLPRAPCSCEFDWKDVTQRENSCFVGKRSWCWYDYWCPVQCNYYILFCVKCFELSHVMNIAPYKCYVKTDKLMFHRQLTFSCKMLRAKSC